MTFLTIWGMVPHWLKASLAGLVAAFLLVSGAYLYGKHEARQQAAVAASEATAKAIQKRANVDEKIIGMDAVALCLELGGMSDECEQLRGVEGNPR